MHFGPDVTQSSESDPACLHDRYQIRTADWSGPSSTWASNRWWVAVPIETSRLEYTQKRPTLLTRWVSF